MASALPASFGDGSVKSRKSLEAVLTNAGVDDVAGGLPSFAGLGVDRLRDNIVAVVAEILNQAEFAVPDSLDLSSVAHGRFPFRSPDGPAL